MREERLGSTDNSEETVEPRLRDRFTETVSRLFRVQENNEDLTEDDADKKSRRKKGKSARWRNFLRGVFSRPAEGDEKLHAEGQKSYMPFITLEHIPLVAKKEKSDEDNVVYAQEKPVEQPYDRREPSIDSSDQTAGGLGESSPILQQRYTETEPVAPKLAEAENEPVHAVVSDPEQGVLQIIHEREQMHTSTDAPQTEKPVEHRSSIDRGARGLAVGLAGMEYLGRKRADRKLEATQKQQAQETQKIPSRQDRQETETQKVRDKLSEQELRYKVAAQAEALRAKRGIEKSHQQTPPQEQAVAPASVESNSQSWSGASLEIPQQQATERRVEQPSPMLSPERERIPTTRHEMSGDRGEVELRNQKSAKETEEYNQKIYENAEKAAAHGVPVEKYYERRHEVKDTQSATSPVSVGSILRDRQLLQREPLAAGGVGHVNPVDNMANVRRQRLQDQQMYVSAAKSGFYTALVLIAVIVTIAVLS